MSLEMVGKLDRLSSNWGPLLVTRNAWSEVDKGEMNSSS
jgi:hypothetical protein